ncbi:MAG: NAD-dependent epimerase/dehydratase family protein [Verrucomicrobia bacterium]|nr:NAD-dependent epimerase/dehydratase family protein [Verrucomicrobiota bacterium]MBU4291089.1 NAD-dependent epimerase/dehydratase family protein [Verrucomicrobiota bacterium]MBU4429361.1 NAD-dependent epimerase/dehydratase family protein [Verrucomicrobiota bacterium]MBU4498126.1 NAD-dependent epimerase/dehydratase family protein [Verrucomicrobiota bacterium]MCG2680106.1 NAD-dependent epimerase/dehydratase family protein [Kiritimatiellia bacterium]
MKIFITGICGFVGSSLARGLREALPKARIAGIDNLVRPGSEINRRLLKPLGISVVHGDIRNAGDLDSCQPADWIIDAAANPSVLAGVDGKTSSRQLVEHNLLGTMNLLELARKWSCGFIMLSSSRVYSIPALAGLKMRIRNQAFVPASQSLRIRGMTSSGITEEFSTQAPVSLYGATKLASECLALEYGSAYDLPVFVNRCGVLAGAGQFGKADQGIFSYWIHAYMRRMPLRYIGFNGRGCQVRDCLHPLDLLALIRRQIAHPQATPMRVLNVSGGVANSMSLARLSAWCAERFGPRRIGVSRECRPFDIPWLVLNAQPARQVWNWDPVIPLSQILDEIARHAEQNPRWLELCGDG